MANIPNTGASCPDGGSFYMCENNATEFVGCCVLDPCADDSGQCPHDDLRPASFWSDNHDDIPEQECSSLSSEAKWYICANNKTNFMGCCDHADPCNAGSCQPGYIAPARLSSNVSDRAAFIEEVMKAEVSASASAATTVTSILGSSSGFHTESTADTTSAAAGGAGGLHTGAVVGITLASTITAIVILAFLVFKFRAGCGLRRDGRFPCGRAAPNGIPKIITPGEGRQLVSELQVVAPGQLITGPANGPTSPFAESFGPRHASRETWMLEPTIPVLVELDGDRWAPPNGRARPNGSTARS